MKRVDTRLLESWERSRRRERGLPIEPSRAREPFLELLAQLRRRLAAEKAALHAGRPRQRPRGRCL